MTLHRIQLNRPLRHVTLVGMEEQVADLVPAGAPVESQVPTEPAVQDNTNEILRTIATEIEALEQQAVATRQELLRTSVALSRMIVEQLVGSSSNLQEQRLTHLVEQALKRSSEAVEVHLNQANLAVIEGYLAEQATASKVTLVADDSVAPGECQVSLDGYDLQSNLVRQLNEIESLLTELIHE